jgi:hypothetical protein
MTAFYAVVFFESSTPHGEGEAENDEDEGGVEYARTHITTNTNKTDEGEINEESAKQCECGGRRA